MRKPQGQRIRRLATELTPGQLGELLAIAQTCHATGKPTMLMVLHAQTETTGHLIRRKMVTWSRPPAEWGTGFRASAPTSLGLSVLLSRVESDLTRSGAISKEAARG